MRRRWILLIGLIALLLPVREAAAELGSFQTTRAVGNGRWEWTIAIRADPTTLRDIFCVEYSLEPTFPHPVRRVCTVGNPRTPFATRGAAWGNRGGPGKLDSSLSERLPPDGARMGA